MSDQKTDRILEDEDVQVLLELLPPSVWNLIARLADTANYKGSDIEDAYALRVFLKSFFHNTEFQRAIGTLPQD